MRLSKFVAEAKKFCVALIAALGQLAVALQDGNVTPSEWIMVGIAFAGALGVYVVVNQPPKA